LNTLKGKLETSLNCNYFLVSTGHVCCGEKETNNKSIAYRDCKSVCCKFIKIFLMQCKQVTHLYYSNFMTVYLSFYSKKTNASTCFGFKQFLSFVTVKPALEKILSVDVNVAGIQNKR